MTTSSSPRLLLISGSAREGSLNTRLLQTAGRKAEALGALITHVDLRALDLPVFDADLLGVKGHPPGALVLRELFASHDGLLLACPEYNALPTPLLINAFDWLSTVSAEGALPGGTAATGGKPVGLLAASPGSLGGLRALPIVRTYLSTNFAMVVVPEQLGLPAADHAFNEGGDLVKPELDAVLGKLVASVVRQARWLRTV
jgi:chromate reductase